MMQDAKIGLYDIVTSTTLKSNKSHLTKRDQLHHYLSFEEVVPQVPVATSQEAR
jgi:hypothetical protein